MCKSIFILNNHYMSQQISNINPALPYTSSPLNSIANPIKLFNQAEWVSEQAIAVNPLEAQELARVARNLYLSAEQADIRNYLNATRSQRHFDVNAYGVIDLEA
jgi:hypothetical protein